MKTAGQRFKEIRIATGLSQEDFGKAINLSKSGISAVENDKAFISLEIQRTLLLDFDVNLNYLVGEVGNMFLPVKYEDIKAEILKEVNSLLKKRGL